MGIFIWRYGEVPNIRIVFVKTKGDVEWARKLLRARGEKFIPEAVLRETPLNHRNRG